MSVTLDVSNIEYKKESDGQIEYLTKKLNDLRVEYGHVSKSLDDEREKSKQLVKENLESAKGYSKLNDEFTELLTAQIDHNQSDIQKDAAFMSAFKEERLKTKRQKVKKVYF